MRPRATTSVAYSWAGTAPTMLVAKIAVCSWKFFHENSSEDGYVHTIEFWPQDATAYLVTCSTAPPKFIAPNRSVTFDIWREIVTSYFFLGRKSHLNTYCLKGSCIIQIINYRSHLFIRIYDCQMYLSFYSAFALTEFWITIIENKNIEYLRLLVINCWGYIKILFLNLIPLR